MTKVMNKLKRDKIFTIILVLAFFGVLLAVYLLWQQIFHPGIQICNINRTVNCDAIISGPVARTLGLPTPLYGLIGYIVILIAARLRKIKVLLATASFGLLFCLWIAYKELFQLHVICPICILCQVIMIAVFTFSLLLNKKNSSAKQHADI